MNGGKSEDPQPASKSGKANQQHQQATTTKILFSKIIFLYDFSIQNQDQTIFLVSVFNLTDHSFFGFSLFCFVLGCWNVFFCFFFGCFLVVFWLFFGCFWFFLFFFFLCFWLFLVFFVFFFLFFWLFFSFLLCVVFQQIKSRDKKKKQKKQIYVFFLKTRGCLSVVCLFFFFVFFFCLFFCLFFPNKTKEFYFKIKKKAIRFIL